MEKESFYSMNEQQEGHEVMPEIHVIKITDGLGFGSGTIAVEPRILSPEDKLNETFLAKVDAMIDSSLILVPVDTDDNGLQIEDDGCGDGRGVKSVFKGTEIKKRSLNRSKVFGGGATMGVAAELANGNELDLEELYVATIDNLDELGIKFGAHTDDHAHGKNCGCGAIDRAPEIIKNAVLYKDQILASIEAVTGTSSAQNVLLQQAYKKFETYASAHTNENYQGAKVMQKIIGSGKIVKELKGQHKEVRVVINTVENYTINQAKIREVSEDTAQVFAVDEWRLKQLSDKMYDTEEQQSLAYFGMLIYTLATAGTLTPGDLKVYAVLSNEQFSAAA